MVPAEQRPKVGPADVGDSPRKRYALPRTIYVYLALLILSYAAPPFLAQLFAPTDKPAPSSATSGLSDSDFEKYVSAETNLKTTLASSSETENKPVGGLGRSLSSVLGARRDKVLQDCRADYVALSASTHSANMGRRVLILDHILGRPLDAAFLERSLRPDLHLNDVPPDQIAKELSMWKAIYGKKRVTQADAAADSKLIRSMNLRFLEPHALADLWHAAGDKNAESAAEDEIHKASAALLGGEAALVVLEIFAFLFGVGGLILFVSAAATGSWRLIHRSATAPLHLMWGELLDAFVFYLAFYRFVSLCGAIVIKLAGAQPDAHQLLLVNATVQILTGAVAVAYLASKAKRHGVTIAEVGMTIRGSLLREVAYGIAGYLSTLPIVLVMALISRQIFRHSTNTAPNPILPLMIGVHDPVSRALIFLMASLAAPFLEETFFRGALFTGLRTRYGWWMSALVSATCFALVHPMQDWLPIFALGVSFATMREMRQSLVPGMTAHFLQNTVTFVALAALFSS